MSIQFKLTDEQLQLVSLAREFTRDRIIPVAAEHDRAESFPWPIIQEAAGLGLLNAGIPEAYGGLGLGMLDECLIGEELAYGCMGIYSILMASELGLTPIELAGSEEQKLRWLAPLVMQPKIAAFALSESGNGSDAAAMSTRAVRDGQDWIINGSKMWITNGGLADLTVVFATTEPGGRAKSSVALVVEKDAPGFSTHKIHGKLGQRAAQTAELTFENVRVPAANLLGEVGDGFKIAMRTLDRTRVPVAAGSVGIIRRALDESVRYAKERQAFGRLIGDFQGVSFKLADMKMRLETSRLITWQAAWLVDEGQPHSVPSAIAKAFASQAAFDSAAEAIQVFGGAGYVNDVPVEKLLRDAKLNMIYEGTNEIQRVVIARALLKN